MQRPDRQRRKQFLKQFKAQVKEEELAGIKLPDCTIKEEHFFKVATCTPSFVKEYFDYPAPVPCNGDAYSIMDVLVSYVAKACWGYGLDKSNILNVCDFLKKLTVEELNKELQAGYTFLIIPHHAKPEFLDQNIPLRKIREYYWGLPYGILLNIAYIVESFNDQLHLIMKTNLIRKIDKMLSQQLDEVLHHPEFQRLEATWRGLQFLVEQTDFRENIEIFLWDVSKGDLSNDLNNTEDVSQSFFSQKINNEYNGMPYPFSAVIAAYEFGPSPEDINLLDRIARVAESAAVPFIAGAKFDFFCKENNFQGFPRKQIDSLFNDPKYIKWRTFRDTNAARFIGLTLPRFRVRLPYKLENFSGHLLNYKEHVGDDPANYLWCNSAFALASRIVHSFAKYRHCANIIGPEDGLIDIPFKPQDSADEEGLSKWTDIFIDEYTEFQLSHEGFIPLILSKFGMPLFFSVFSCQKPRIFTDKNVTRDFHLGAQLPHLFFILRFYQYLSVLRREMKHLWKTREELETGLNRWLYRYQDYPSEFNPDIPIIHEWKPLMRGQVKIEEAPENPGRYKGYLSITPRWKYMGDRYNLYFRFFWKREG
jgi:type VI secretion system protein ImpC